MDTNDTGLLSEPIADRVASLSGRTWTVEDRSRFDGNDELVARTLDEMLEDRRAPSAHPGQPSAPSPQQL